MQNRDASRWRNYYSATKGRSPRPLLVDTLVKFATEENQPGNEQTQGIMRSAIDLGCGNGQDTHEMLHCGWRVLAIDYQQEAIARTLEATSAEDLAQLEVQNIAFEEIGEKIELPPCHLINAAFSLPFCPPDAFAHLWTQIVLALQPGGRFCGQLFGKRDSWATRREMTTHSAEQITQLFAQFEVEILQEKEEDGITAIGRPKHWHIFDIVARKSP